MGLKVRTIYGQQKESIQKMETPSTQHQKMNPSSYMNRRRSSSQPKTERSKEEKDKKEKKEKE